MRDRQRLRKPNNYTVPPRHLIYCWRCNIVEVMEQGRASEGFLAAHDEHKLDTQRIEIYPKIHVSAATASAFRVQGFKHPGERIVKAIKEEAC